MGMPVDAVQFADTTLSRDVEFGRHAVSIDEQRVTSSRPSGPPIRPQIGPTRIVQVLFPGGHSDVGGGYPRPASPIAP